MLDSTIVLEYVLVIYGFLKRNRYGKSLEIMILDSFVCLKFTV